MRPFLPYSRQCLDAEDITAVTNVLKSDWLTTGPEVTNFEKLLAVTCNVEHVVSCTSATAGLHLAALALGLGEGVAVIVPSLTFLASASAPFLAGAEIVFADVDEKTGLLTPETFLAAIERHSSSPIKAVVVVHLTGRVCDMVGIKKIADLHGIRIIEDSSHALGASYLDESENCHLVGACSHSEICVFSFHPVKAIATGEGGAVTTNSFEIAEKINLLRSHGMLREPRDWVRRDLGFDAAGKANPWYYEMSFPAFNYRMSDINAALGVSQLKKLDRFLKLREAMAQRYSELLQNLHPLVEPPVLQDKVRSGWHLYSISLDFEAIGINRGDVMASLRERGIGTQVHYIPLHLQPFWSQMQEKNYRLRGAEYYYDRTLSVPLFPSMSLDDVQYVVDAVSEIIVS